MRKIFKRENTVRTENTETFGSIKLSQDFTGVKELPGTVNELSETVTTLSDTVDGHTTSITSNGEAIVAAQGLVNKCKAAFDGISDACDDDEITTVEGLKAAIKTAIATAFPEPNAEE